MARTKRSIPQENKRRPYDQAAERPPRAGHGRVYDQAQERLDRTASGYGAYDDTLHQESVRRGFYDQQTGRMRPAAAEPEVLTRSNAHSGMQELGFTVPVHTGAAQETPHRKAAPETPVKKQTGRAARKAAAAARKKQQAARRQAEERSARAVRSGGMPEEDDAPLPTTLRQRGQASRRRANRRRALLLSILVLLLVGIWVLIAFVFKIGEIRVSGSSVYNQTVILENFGYRVGDNLFTFSKRRVQGEMLAALPYLETVKIRRQLPGTVRIEVTASEEKYCFVQQDGSTVITTPSFKVLRVGSNSGGLLSIRGVAFAAPVAGQPLALQQEEDPALQTLTEVLTALEAGHIKSYSELDVSDPYAISLKCEDRFLLQLGTTVELDYKLRLAAKSIYDLLDADAMGVIDVSGAGTSHSAYYRPQAVD